MPPTASGKVLRVVRTTVDSEGRQVVRTTYSVNSFAVSQAWAKHALVVSQVESVQGEGRRCA
jgi:hypothetical protein